MNPSLSAHAICDTQTVLSATLSERSHVRKGHPIELWTQCANQKFPVCRNIQPLVRPTQTNA